MANTFKIKCSACPRTYDMNLQLIATKVICQFCGGTLAIPEDLLAEARKIAAPPTRRTPINVECLVCARALIIKPDAFGRTTKCSYCTAPLTVSSDGVLSAPPQLAKRAIEEELVAKTSCPQCRQGKLELQPGAGIAVRCTACGHTTDLATGELDAYLPIARPGNALMTDFARMALQARWQRREVSLTEAAGVLEEIAQLDAWAAKKSSLLSPFDVEMTAEIVQYAVMCNSSAMSNWMDDKLMLIFPMRSQNDSNALDGGALSRGVAMGLGAMGRSSYSAFAMARRASQDKGPKELQGEPATCLLLTPHGTGCDLSVLTRTPNGDLGEAPPKLDTQVNTAIRGAFLNAARQYLAFKAIYGTWANGEMLYGSSAKGLQKRLETLGGVLRDRAAELAPALLPKAALQL